MNLTDKLKKLVELEGIDESELVLEEVEYFQIEHADHGSYNLNFVYNGEDIKEIYLECWATDLVNMEVCSHNNPDVLSELRCSIIYPRDSYEAKLQAEMRRE